MKAAMRFSGSGGPALATLAAAVFAASLLCGGTHAQDDGHKLLTRGELVKRLKAGQPVDGVDANEGRGVPGVPLPAQWAPARKAVAGLPGLVTDPSVVQANRVRCDARFASNPPSGLALHPPEGSYVTAERFFGDSGTTERGSLAFWGGVTGGSPWRTHYVGATDKRKDNLLHDVLFGRPATPSYDLDESHAEQIKEQLNEFGFAELARRTRIFVVGAPECIERSRTKYSGPEGQFVLGTYAYDPDFTSTPQYRPVPALARLRLQWRAFVDMAELDRVGDTGRGLYLDVYVSDPAQEYLPIFAEELGLVMGMAALHVNYVYDTQVAARADVQQALAGHPARFTGVMGLSAANGVGHFDDVDEFFLYPGVTRDRMFSSGVINTITREGFRELVRVQAKVCRTPRGTCPTGGWVDPGTSCQCTYTIWDGTEYTGLDLCTQFGCTPQMRDITHDETEAGRAVSGG